ncbi:hypothetical protein [Peptostreptococcus porci]|nr:hypothetical protein [Peptostreptococcus porci]MDY5435857.1 hypothetical protein [Peptostreptococcus porci]
MPILREIRRLEKIKAKPRAQARIIVYLIYRVILKEQMSGKIARTMDY